MANYFMLEINALPPVVSVTPRTIKNFGVVELNIIANEELADYQDIYLVDSSGRRFDLIFEKETNKFFGNVDFSSVSRGAASLYIKIMDTMENVLDTVETLSVGKPGLGVSAQETVIGLSYEELD